MEIRIYYEGDGNLKEGFRKFFSEIFDLARQNGHRISLICTNGTPCRDFGIAIKTHAEAWNILLRDSEGPDTGDLSATLCQTQGWHASHKASVFWMVEMMESWFHGDKDALENFYGEGFRRSALKQAQNVEKISKKDLIKGLSAATKKTQKGDYYHNKTIHGPKLLALISASRVKEAAPNCCALFEAVRAKLAL